MTISNKKRDWYSMNFAAGVGVLLGFRWASFFVKELGFVPYRGLGLILGFTFFVSITFVLLLADYGLSRWGLDRSVRTGIWISAAFGPYAGFVALNEWGHIAGSQIIGFLSTVLAFGIGYGGDKLLLKRSEKG